MTRRLRFVVIVAAVAVSGPGMTTARGQAPAPTPLRSPFVPIDVAERMLELAGVTKTDVVYDLGCGDGRIAITAAKKYGARAVGIEIDPTLIVQANANAQKEGVSNLVQFIQQDTADLSKATVVAMTIPQSAPWLGHNGLLGPMLAKQLKAGARIVTTFVSGSMSDWKPSRVDRFADADGKARAILYLWTYGGTAAP